MNVPNFRDFMAENRIKCMICIVPEHERNIAHKECGGICYKEYIHITVETLWHKKVKK